MEISLLKSSEAKETDHGLMPRVRLALEMKKMTPEINPRGQTVD
jgi:hypothetical protein